MTDIPNEQWKFCGAFAGPRHEPYGRWECLLCGARFNNEGPPVAGVHPDAMCPMGISAPREVNDDEGTV